MKRELKKCKNCNETILNGRSDKKCRYDYHNKNGLRTQVYKFHLENKEQIINYIETKIKAITYENDEIRRKLEKVGINSHDNVGDQIKLLKHREELTQLRKMKKLMPSEWKVIKPSS